MFNLSYRLPVKLLGIPVKLDASFLLVLAFFTWVIGGQVDTYIALLNLPVNPNTLTRGATPYLLGLLSGLGLLLCVLVHELGHALAARRYGVEVQEITLWLLGGVAQFNEMPRQRGAEAVVGIAGPVTSVGLSGLFYALWQVTPNAAGAAQFIFSYLTWANLLLAIFNLLPALPLDGGRVLRSLLALRMGQLKATRISANISRVIAILLGLYGLVTFNFILVLIAFFVYNAVRAETQYAVVSKTLKGISVRDIMTQNVASVTPDMRVSDLVRLIAFKKHLGYPVVDDEDRLVGLVKLQEARDADDDQRIEEIMTREVYTVTPGTEALEALRTISDSPTGRLVVVDGTAEGARRVVGILSKTDLIRAVKTHMADDENVRLPDVTR